MAEYDEETLADLLRTLPAVPRGPSDTRGGRPGTGRRIRGGDCRGDGRRSRGHGRPRFEGTLAGAGGVIGQAEAFRARVAPLAQADAEAYTQALAALRG